MNKFIFFIPLLLLFTRSYSQQGDTTKDNKSSLPYYIEICKDKMTDKEYAFGSKMLICSETGEKGFKIRISWDNKKGKVSYNSLVVFFLGTGNCNENNELIFLFEDNTKYSLKSWNEWNCNGTSYFDSYHKSFDKLNTKKIKVIRFINGRTLDSYTYTLLEKEQSFFIEAKKAFDENKFVSIKCDD